MPLKGYNRELQRAQRRKSNSDREDSVKDEDGITKQERGEGRQNNKDSRIFMTRLTELRVKVCSMYGTVCVCLARPQRCSTRLVCVNESIRRSSAVRVRVGVCSAERQGSTGEERACRRAENPDSYWEFKSSLSLPLLPVPLSLSLSLFAVNSSSFPLCSPPSPSLCLHAFLLVSATPTG